jgi:hypothetical protein
VASDERTRNQTAKKKKTWCMIRNTDTFAIHLILASKEHPKLQLSNARE